MMTKQELMDKSEEAGFYVPVESGFLNGADKGSSYFWLVQTLIDDIQNADGTDIDTDKILLEFFVWCLDKGYIQPVKPILPPALDVEYVEFKNIDFKPIVTKYGYGSGDGDGFGYGDGS